MSFDYQFAGEIDSHSLYQGDLLIRNEALKAALAPAHAYYAEEPSYSHFMVLTQSCDLVRRGRKPPKSRYITLAAARPLPIMFDRVISKSQHSNPPDFPLVLCDAARQLVVRQTLERLLHNSEDGYFFFRAGSHSAIDTDLCVFLALSVPIRADHYDTCLQAKVVQLDDVFQAKVGWLAGNLYSRVGTPDFEEHMPAEAAKAVKEDFYKVAMTRTAWLTPGQLAKLRELYDHWREAHPGQALDEEGAFALIDKVPPQAHLAVDRAIEVLAKEGLLAPGADARARATNLLKSDTTLKKHLRYAAELPE